MPIYELLELIGKYFRQQIIEEQFLPDPPMSFTIDDDIDSDIENCLRIALNHGAIVCYESADGLGGFHSLKNKRFRLSYLLSPEFDLPIRKSAPVKLKKILYSKGTDKQGQLDL